MTYMWNAPLSLSSKPKGARKQAADDRLKRYQKLFLEAASTVAFESGSSAVVVPLNKVARKAARRARQREEMLQAASSLMEDSATDASRSEGEETAKPIITSIGGVSAIFSRSKLAAPKPEVKEEPTAPAPSTTSTAAGQTLLNAHLQVALTRMLAAQSPLGLSSLLANPSAAELLQQQQQLVQMQLVQAQAAQLRLQLQAQQLLQAQQAAAAAAAATTEETRDSSLRPASPAEAHQLLALSQAVC